jgi:hypothetical protein
VERVWSESFVSFSLSLLNTFSQEFLRGFRSWLNDGRQREYGGRSYCC